MDYSKIKFNFKEKIINVLSFIFSVWCIAILFFDNYRVMFILFPGYWPYIKLIKKQVLAKRKKELRSQFNDAIKSLADNMAIGMAVENAITEVVKEMELVYSTTSYISIELKEISRRVALKTPIELCFKEFANRADIDEITLFAQCFAIVKRTGGDMCGLIRMISTNISQNIKTEEEISMAINEKAMEAKIMLLVPVGILCYVRFASSGFLDVMYTTVAGQIVMVLSLVVYGVVIYMVNRIMEISMD